MRAVAGEPAKLQMLDGMTGERRTEERELPWLPGYEGARPVRTGNAAAGQIQLDIHGELLDTLFVAHTTGLKTNDDA